MSRRLGWLLLWCLPLGAVAPPSGLPASTGAKLAAILADPALRDGFAGALVIALGQGGAAHGWAVTPYDGGARPVLFQQSADKLFVPASNLKLVTSAAALAELGPTTRLVTRVVASTPNAAGRRHLWLVGGGDPALGPDDLQHLAAAVAAAGVRSVAGVDGDTSRYGDRWSDGWTVDDLPWYYAPEITALTLSRNQVDAYCAPGAAVGDRARVWLQPATAGLTLDARVLTGPAGSASAVTWDRAPGQTTCVVRGQIAVDREHTLTEGLAVPRPEVWAAQVFAQFLREVGVDVSGPVAAAQAPAGAAEVARHESPPIATLLQRLLKHSDNLYAELLFRELGYRTAGAGTTAGGAHGVRAFLQRSGVDPASLRLVDGSGLSRYNLVSPRTVCGVLRAMANHPARDAFVAALPIAGVDGTLRNRFKGTAAEGTTRAKTGFLTNHTSLSGYVTTRSGDVLVVSTMFNHCLAETRTLRAVHDRFFAALAAWSR